MQHQIIISRTFSEITPESAEGGDFSDHGFISEREEVSFHELVRLMREHRQPSSSTNNGGTDVWFSTGFSTEDFSTGTESEQSIHFHKENEPHMAKYWKWAAVIAGNVN